VATKELRDLSTGELESQVEDAREELMNLRFQQSTGELTDHTRVHVTRRHIARLMTIIHERESFTNLEGEE